MTSLGAPPLKVFGTEHLILLGIFAVGCVAMYLLGRRLPPAAARRFEVGFGTLILLVCVPYAVHDWTLGLREGAKGMQLQICDFAWIATAAALFTRNTKWAGLAYFWGLTLCLQGVLTPVLSSGFPSVTFWGFFMRHMTPPWVGVYLVGARLGPSWRDFRLAFLVTLAWALAMMPLNAALGTNYGFLNHKPSSHSLLDLFGPWPLYVVVEMALVVCVWALMTWPWNRRQVTEPAVAGAAAESGG